MIPVFGSSFIPIFPTIPSPDEPLYLVPSSFCFSSLFFLALLAKYTASSRPIVTQGMAARRKTNTFVMIKTRLSNDFAKYTSFSPKPGVSVPGLHPYSTRVFCLHIGAFCMRICPFYRCLLPFFPRIYRIAANTQAQRMVSMPVSLTKNILLSPRVIRPNTAWS